MSKLELLEKSVDVVVNEKWLLRVNIVVEKVRSDPPTSEWSLRTEIEADDGGDTDRVASPPIEALMAPGMPVCDAKALVARLRGFRPADQRLYTQRGAPLFAGALNASGGTSLDLKLRVIPLNSKVEALFDIVHMGNVNDRDSMMERLITPRNAKDCPCEEGSLSFIEQAPSNAESCNFCHLVCRSVHTCVICGFTLCPNCYESDTDGRDVAVFPHDDIQNIAYRLGHELAQAGADFIDYQHLYHVPSLSWHSSWGEVSPPIFFRRHQIRIRNETTVLQKSIRLVVRISDRIRDILDNAGLLVAGVDPIERNEILTTAMTVSDFIRIRCAWENSRAWLIAKNKLLDDRFPNYQRAKGNPPEVYYGMRLRSYTFEEVVYELYAYVEDSDTEQAS